MKSVRVRRVLTLFSLVLTAVLATTGISAQAAPDKRDGNSPAADHGPYYIVSWNSGRCVNVQGGSTANGAAIIQYDCVNFANNKWYFNGPHGGENGYYYIWSQNSGRCLNVQGASLSNGAPIIQYDCSNFANNHWYVFDPGDGHLYIHARHSYMCLNVFGGSTANGTPIIQYDCLDRRNNEWYLVSA